MTWGFGVVLGDDDEWPEPRAHDESKCDALMVAKRLALFEAILRVPFAARREKERDVGHMLPKPAEPETEGAESEAGPAGVSPELTKLYGTEVACMQLELCKQSLILERDDQASASPLAAREGTEYSEFDREVYATHAQCSERRTRAQVAGHDVEARNDQSNGAFASGSRASAPQPGTTAIEIVRLQEAHMLTKEGTETSGGTVYLREAQSGEAAVRMVFEAVRIVPTGERTTAAAFAHDAIEGAKSGDWLEMAEQLLVPLSPRAQETGLSTTQSLAWLRSKSAEEMLKKVETRLRQMVARNMPGGTRRDATQSSPARARHEQHHRQRRNGGCWS